LDGINGDVEAITTFFMYDILSSDEILELYINYYTGSVIE